MITISYGRRVVVAGAAILSALALAACKSDADNTAPVASPTVTVIGIDTDESELLTELYASALETSGYRVACRAPVADLAAGYAALNNGAADVFVSYTAELLDFLVETEPELAAATSTTAAVTTTTAAATSTTATPDATAEPTVDSADIPGTSGPDDTSTDDTSPDDTSTDDTSTSTAIDASTTSVIDQSSTTTTISIVGQAASISINLQVAQIGEVLPDTLQIGSAATAEKKSVIACTSTVATAGALSTLSDVGLAADTLRLAGTSEWPAGDPFGAPGFEAVYGAEFSKFEEVGADAIGAAITPETPEVDPTSTTAADQSTTTTVPAPVVTAADCGAFASSLDPTIPFDAVVMDDNLNWIRSNGVVPLLTAEKYVLVSQVVDQVSQRLTTADLRDMLSRVSAGASPNVVAEEFIARSGIGG